MRRKLSRSRLLAGTALLALLLGGANAGAQNAGIVGRSLIVPLNGTVRLQMSTKKAISNVSNPKEGFLSIRTVVGDPSTVLITGVQPDVAEVTLTDVDGKKETYQVLVQLDIEYLKTQIKRAIPSANVNPIPVGNNAVILAGTVDKVEHIQIIENIAKSLNISYTDAIVVGGVQQVQLDVVVASVTRSENRSIGFDFLTNSHNFYFGSTVAQAVGEPAAVGIGQSAVFGAAPLLIGSPSADTNILTGVIHNGYGFLAFVNALRQEGVAKLLAQPRLVTKSGRPASFLVGGEQAVPVPAGLGQVGVQFEEFGTRLNFLPIVLGNGKIHLEVEPEISNLNAANGISLQGFVVPGRDTQRINTTVELETGQTFVIGGLIQHRVSTNTRKTPVLGDVPFFGTFFSRKIDNVVEQEVVILVTPHLVDGQSCDQVTKVLPGQETRTPDDFELFLEGILEAPRGPRQVCEDGHYVPAFKRGPSAELFPCAGNGRCGANGEGCAGSATGNCAGSTTGAAAAQIQSPVPAGVTVAPPAKMPSAEPTDPIVAKPAETPPATETSPRPVVLPPVLEPTPPPAPSGGQTPGQLPAPGDKP